MAAARLRHNTGLGLRNGSYTVSLNETTDAKGSQFFGRPGDSGGGASTLVQVLGRLSSVSQVSKYNGAIVPILDLSTGDTCGRAITTSVEPNTQTFSVSYSTTLLSNPNSNCQATLTIPGGTATGYINSAVSGSPSGCSGIFSVRARANGRDSINDSSVVVPPQILIQMMYGEAHGQIAAGDNILAVTRLKRLLSAGSW